MAADSTTVEVDNLTVVEEVAGTTSSRVEVAVVVAGRERYTRSVLGLRLRISYWNETCAGTSMNGLDGWQRKGDDAQKDIAIPDWERLVRYVLAHA